MNRDERKAWVRTLKVGDRVIVDGKRRCTVTAIAHGCPSIDGTKFDRSGDSRSDAWSIHRIESWDAVLATKIAEGERIDGLRGRLIHLRRVDVEALTVPQLEGIVAILDEPPTPVKEGT